MPTVLDLLDEWRDHVDDRGGDVDEDENDPFWVENDETLLWKNREAFRFLRRALTEIGVRRRGYEDVDTATDNKNAPICRIPLVAGTATYAYSQTILRIENVRLGSSGATVHKTTQERLNRLYEEQRQNWRIQTGEVCYYIEDIDARTITLYKTPTSADTLYLKVRRLPLTAVGWRTLSTNIPELNNDLLIEATIEYMSYRAYSKQDADAENTKRAMDALVKFTQLVGPSVDEKTLTAWRANANFDMSVAPSTWEHQMGGRHTERNPFIAGRSNGKWGLGDN